MLADDIIDILFSKGIAERFVYIMQSVIGMRSVRLCCPVIGSSVRNRSSDNVLLCNPGPLITSQRLQRSHTPNNHRSFFGICVCSEITLVILKTYCILISWPVFWKKLSRAPYIKFELIALLVSCHVFRQRLPLVSYAESLRESGAYSCSYCMPLRQFILSWGPQLLFAHPLPVHKSHEHQNINIGRIIDVLVLL